MSRRDPNPFGPELLAFLRRLQRNNERDWFESHREQYESVVREPALQFIRQMARHVHAISPHLRADDRKVGGSLMRVHRDVRFSRDKRPYKTNVGIQFRHVAGKDVHAPGLYFHAAPGEVFLGAGMWHPDARALAAVRAAMTEDPRAWLRVRDAGRFRDRWRLGGDSLKRAPRGYADDDPLIEDLKRKDHIAVCDLEEADVAAADLIDSVAESFRRAGSFLGWQARALGLDF